jgi:hypothetical protein
MSPVIGILGATDVWDSVTRLVDRAPSAAALRSHRLELLAARRWRALGRAVPRDFVEHERAAALSLITAPLVLERVRAACDAPMILFKGLEIAARYPDPALRGFGDVDLLAPDPAPVQEALLRAGFRPVGEPGRYVGIHHLQPLRWPGLAVSVEVHSHPKWLDGRPPPPVAQLLASAVASDVATGFLALPPAQHAVLVAVHSWAHDPLACIRDLVDVAVVGASADAGEADAFARAWDIEGLWTATTGAVGALLGEGRRPFALRSWARNLESVRERTVFENHLRRWLSDFSVLPTGAALRRLPATLAGELRPHQGESRRAKLVRSANAIRNAFQPHP